MAPARPRSTQCSAGTHAYPIISPGSVSGSHLCHQPSYNSRMYTTQMRPFASAAPHQQRRAVRDHEPPGSMFGGLRGLMDEHPEHGSFRER
jgi:hypothetical protein